jgi:hypothetical protein
MASENCTICNGLMEQPSLVDSPPMLTILECGDNGIAKLNDLIETRHWTHLCHADFSYKTNDLFETLFLGIQRLEDTGVLPVAHQAMLEDMLECWTNKDDLKLNRRPFRWT